MLWVAVDYRKQLVFLSWHVDWLSVHSAYNAQSLQLLHAPPLYQSIVASVIARWRRYWCINNQLITT